MEPKVAEALESRNRRQNSKESDQKIDIGAGRRIRVDIVIGQKRHQPADLTINFRLRGRCAQPEPRTRRTAWDLDRRLLRNTGRGRGFGPTGRWAPDTAMRRTNTAISRSTRSQCHMQNPLLERPLLITGSEYSGSGLRRKASCFWPANHAFQRIHRRCQPFWCRGIAKPQIALAGRAEGAARRKADIAPVNDLLAGRHRVGHAIDHEKGIEGCFWPGGADPGPGVETVEHDIPALQAAVTQFLIT